ncbi:MAG TPA: D-alanyl-D-alanine carboxypeptidase [Marmoricola sp.]|nr:D-alanyl-D-alanine carboxypeptidase [Marmoricola sp.]
MRTPERVGVVVALAASTLFALIPSAISATGPATQEVVLTASTPLRATPGPGALLVRNLAVKAADRAPMRLVVGEGATVGGVPWLHVTDGALTGWVRQANTARTAVPFLTPDLTRRLTGLASSVPGDVGIVVMDRAGHVEWAFHPYRARILASNTKLFVTGRAAHRSAGIGGELRSILAPSNNVLAQQMYVAEGGGRPITQFADSLHASITLRDGSGLSRANVASPLSVATYLVGMTTDQHFAEWFNALPIAGVSGTLADRMVGTAAQGRCHAKTGTLTGVSALSGYCTTVAGRHLVFSILINGVRGVDAARKVQDRIAALLAQQG